jgi:hypothetical protein
MILLGSFLHRQELADIIGRALEARLRPEDAFRLKVLVNLNSYALRLYSSTLAESIFRDVVGTDVAQLRAHTKGELKDLIASNPPYVTSRIDDLVQRYRKFPEDYYRETPYEGVAFTVGDPPRYVGSRRIKRIRRIAEKCSRRIVDYLIEQVRQRADELAAERARRVGVSKEQLITPPDEMAEEYRHAERRVMKSVREGLFAAAMPQFYIDDGVGIRIVASAASSPGIDEYLRGRPDLTVVDEKRFSGRYSGRNMVMAWRLPRDALALHVPDEAAERVLLARGVAPNRHALLDRWSDFVLTAEGHVRFEVALIDYEALLESEIGRSMHEEHILELREMPQYRGRLAQNVESLMLFLFAYALSSATTLDELPIRLNGTYLPDYIDSVLRPLYDQGAGVVGLTM